MKIFILYYQNPFIGNCSTDTIEIPNNKILVSELKNLIYEKYRIHQSQQRLTTKIADITLVTMTNEWPLSFFYIREHSKIYLEFIQYVDKSEEIFQKKVLSNAKSKYLKTLGFFKHFAPTLGVIQESQNEYNDELLQKKRTNLSQSFTKEEVRDLIITSVKNNNVQQFRELMEQYDLFEVDVKSNSGWNPLHYACYYGHSDIAYDLIMKHQANVNIPNVDGWTPLHLSSFKGHQEIVKLLLSLPDTDINCNVPGIGTPLHCACKKNNLQVVSILLFKADFNILDSNGNLSISLTTDKNIKKIINKYDKPAPRKKDKPSKDIDFTKYGIFKSIEYIPPKPPKVKGYVEKMGKFIINFHERFIEIDPIVGSFRRYKSQIDYPSNSIETIPLKDIVACKKNTSWYNSNNFHYFEIYYKQRQLYRVKTQKACEKWIESINASIIYNKFWMGLVEKNSSILDYLYKQKEEELLISDIQIIEERKENNKSSINEGSSNEINRNSQIEKNEGNSTKSMSSKRSSDSNTLGGKEKKRERRKNPFSQMNNEEEEAKLIDDCSLTKGINYSSFEILECLGSGTFGKVFKVKLKQTRNIYAMKIINKKYLIKNQQLRYAVTECNVLKQAQHPFIITLHFAFQTPDHLYMILDYCPGGDFSYHIAKHLFEEDEAKFFIAELILAIEHLHNMDIIYRDLKPDNILIDAQGHIKLADFGLAKENVTDNKIAQSFCGSPAYLTPEMVNRKGVGKAADIYGVGAVLYEMMSGTPPFYAHDLSTMYKNISNNNLWFHDYFSEELRDLLKKLLSRDPKNRIGVKSKEEIKNHEFFAEIDWDLLYKKKIPPPINLVDIKEDFFDDLNITSKDSIKFNDTDYQPSNADFNRVKQFTFVRPHSPRESGLVFKG